MALVSSASAGRAPARWRVLPADVGPIGRQLDSVRFRKTAASESGRRRFGAMQPASRVSIDCAFQRVEQGCELPERLPLYRGQLAQRLESRPPYRRLRSMGDVQLAEELVEQVSLGLAVPVSGCAAGIEVATGARGTAQRGQHPDRAGSGQAPVFDMSMCHNGFLAAGAGDWRRTGEGFQPAGIGETGAVVARSRPVPGHRSTSPVRENW